MQGIPGKTYFFFFLWARKPKWEALTLEVYLGFRLLRKTSAKSGKLRVSWEDIK